MKEMGKIYPKKKKKVGEEETLLVTLVHASRRMKLLQISDRTKLSSPLCLVHSSDISNSLENETLDCRSRQDQSLLFLAKENRGHTLNKNVT